MQDCVAGLPDGWRWSAVDARCLLIGQGYVCDAPPPAPIDDLMFVQLAQLATDLQAYGHRKAAEDIRDIARIMRERKEG